MCSHICVHIWQCPINTAMSVISSNKLKKQPRGNHIWPMAEMRICAGCHGGPLIFKTICSNQSSSDYQHFKIQVGSVSAPFGNYLKNITWMGSNRNWIGSDSDCGRTPIEAESTHNESENQYQVWVASEHKNTTTEFDLYCSDAA